MLAERRHCESAWALASLLLLGCADHTGPDPDAGRAREAGVTEGGANHLPLHDAGGDATGDAEAPTMRDAEAPTMRDAEAPTMRDASTGEAPDAGDAAVDIDCAALESDIADAIAASSTCTQDDDCMVTFSPLCGASSTRFDNGCFVFANASADHARLATLAAACTANACVDGCMPADCDCPEEPGASCVGGLCRAEVMESELGACVEAADCIVVPYDHCCGSTKRAINAAFQRAYEDHPSWQRFDDPAACAVLGQCLDDQSVTDATCTSGRCELVYP